VRLRYGPSTDVDDDFAGIVGRTKDLHTITRSTAPLLLWWRDHAQEKLLPAVDLSHALARFEYAVPARCEACGEGAGRGKASMTDVMVSIDDHAIAVEVKYTEPRYETVAAWRKKGRDGDNRDRVIGHWRHLIEAFTEAQIDRASLDGLVYQTVHRTGSACAAAPTDGVAHVMYLAFIEWRADAGPTDYVSDLGAAARVLDPQQRMRFTVVTVPTTKGDAFHHVAELLNAEATDEHRAELLADALVSRREIYRFGEPGRFRVK
jgi:hypothetical protein